MLCPFDREKLEYDVFETAPGWMGALASTRGLVALTFPHPSPAEARNDLFKSGLPASRSVATFQESARELRAYFAGEKVSFSAKLDPRAGTPFQRRVWDLARQIPYGESRTYSWIAGQAGRPTACRAAGNALGRNPVPIIVPCHRVIGKDGKLHGFRGGLDWKNRLLAMEKGGQS